MRCPYNKFYTTVCVVHTTSFGRLYALVIRWSFNKVLADWKCACSLVKSNAYLIRWMCDFEMNATHVVEQIPSQSRVLLQKIWSFGKF